MTKTPPKGWLGPYPHPPEPPAPPAPNMKEVIEELIEERGSTHGDWYQQSAKAQGIKKELQTSVNWNNLSNSHKDALEMIAVKLSRILTGDPDEADHWDDIAGYARLGKCGHSRPE